MNLRESLQAEIASAETEVSSLKAKLAALESNFVELLEKDIDVVKNWFSALAAHLKL